MKTDKMTFLRLIVYIVSLAVCIAVPLMQYVRYSKVLKDGKKFMFRVKMYDPYDVMRGRFVRVQLMPDICSCNGPDLPHHTAIYVSLKTGADGMAEVSGYSTEKPLDGDYWAGFHYLYLYGKNFHIGYPVDRFYLHEDLAAEAENMVRDTKHNVTAEVRLLDGTGLIREIYVDGIPLAESVRRSLKE